MNEASRLQSDWRDSMLKGVYGIAIFMYIVQAIIIRHERCRIISLMTILISGIFFLASYYLYNKDVRYKKILVPIHSKEMYEKNGKRKYRLKFDWSVVHYHYIYITKEAYDLLIEGEDIPCIYDINADSLALDKKEFSKLIKGLKDGQVSK